MSSNAWFAKDLAWGLHKLLQWTCIQRSFLLGFFFSFYVFL
jgi:hypothetical protein